MSYLLVDKNEFAILGKPINEKTNKMKTMNEKAIDYCLEKKGQIHQEFIDDFEAGYKAAQEWISVYDELPNEHESVLVKLNCDTILLGVIDDNNEWGVYYSD